MSTPDPFAEAKAYRRAGWPGTLRLPYRKKAPPPEGFTGGDGPWPTNDDLAEFRREGPGNIALRLPKFVLGIDVDDYGTKEGGATLAALEAKLGPLPPTWWTTSRDDGVSGIRFFLVSHEIDAWPTGAGPEIELISRGHRYAVVWPSEHPEGRTYRWRRPDGSWAEDGEIPSPGDLPELPAAWLEHLTGVKQDGTHDPSHTKPGSRAERRRHARAAQGWLDALPRGEPCTYVGKLAADALASARRENGSAHDSVLGDVMVLLRAGERGHPGVPDVLDTVRAQFVDTVASSRGGEATAGAEFDRLTLNGVEKVLAKPDERAGHGCDCREIDAGSTRVVFSEGLPPFVRAADATHEPPPAFLADGFLLDGEIVQITGDGGVGKTSVALAIAGAVAADRAVFDRFPVRRTGPVMIVSEEDGAGVIANRLQALCQGHGWDPELVMGSCHILARSGVRVSDAAWQEHIMACAREIEPVLILFDPLGEIIDGDENSNTDARPAIRYFRRLTEELGACVIVLHHAGKKSEGKRKLDRSVRGASAWNAAARAIYFLQAVEGGIAVETLKLSRAEPPRPFVLSRLIETGDSPAVWASARLSWHSAREVSEKLAESFVLDQLTAEPGPNSSALKEAAKERNARGVEPTISGKDVSDALNSLHKHGRIEYAEGARGSRNWYRVTLPTDDAPDLAGQGGQGDPFRLPDLAGQGQTPLSATLPTPIGGKASGGRSGQAGQAGLQRMCRTCGTHIGPTVDQCATCKYAEAPA